YGEKLATPDVSVADLIGDIDPIKAASQRLHYAHEGAIHFGIIPRSNRGIFVINEVPDLQPRIQVALFNILQERDIQIRGFNVRLPMDIVMVFTANPEDYTNRGSIVTPLKDRIQSQILTHYPRTIEDGMAITQQESWVERSGMPLIIPNFMRQIVESVAMIARTSEYVDQSSGVSARLTISTMENVVSNAERRAFITGEDIVAPRLCDLSQALSGITGKVELVFEGENEGPQKVARALIGKAVREVFKFYMPDPNIRRSRKGTSEENPAPDPYTAIVRWFEQGHVVHVDDGMTNEEFYNALVAVPTLAQLASTNFNIALTGTISLATAMEFILDALHQHSKLAKDDSQNQTTYRDLVGSIFTMTDD
ncbi:MAG: sigma 54-interacting transcriptional regulator, partial [Candidatus Kapabacteria bacterium]|nr:sigma 54-interacting transcriptional regulator [Candidatus Kapabacteria bacterium]